MSTAQTTLLKYHHHYGTHLLKNLVKKTFDVGIKLYSFEQATQTNIGFDIT